MTSLLVLLHESVKEPIMRTRTIQLVGSQSESAFEIGQKLTRPSYTENIFGSKTFKNHECLIQTCKHCPLKDDPMMQFTLTGKYKHAQKTPFGRHHLQQSGNYFKSEDIIISRMFNNIKHEMEIFGLDLIYDFKDNRPKPIHCYVKYTRV